MKKILLIISGFLMLQGALAQQRPHYTQYILNNYILNPALSGIENYTDLKISHRNQWVGLDGAPVTTYLTVHTPIGKKDYKTSATSYAIPGENPRGKAYWQNYSASEPHQGVGFAMINDRTGLYNRFTAYGSYAYHIGLNPKTNLSAGFSAGVTNISYDREKVKFGTPFDPVLGNTSGNTLNRLRPDIGAGLWLYSSDYFLGLSAQQLVPQRYLFTDDATFEGAKLIPHFFATAGYRFLLNEDINAIPSVMFKYVEGSPTTPQFEFNVKLQYRDLVWAGASYRLQDGYAAMVGMNVGNTFNVGYAYDFTTTRLNTASRGTHEIILGFLLGNKFGDTCPRNIW